MIDTPQNQQFSQFQLLQKLTVNVDKVSEEEVELANGDIDVVGIDTEVGV